MRSDCFISMLPHNIDSHAPSYRAEDAANEAENRRRLSNASKPNRLYCIRWQWKASLQTE